MSRLSLRVAAFSAGDPHQGRVRAHRSPLPRRLRLLRLRATVAGFGRALLRKQMADRYAELVSSEPDLADDCRSPLLVGDTQRLCGARWWARLSTEARHSRC
ncbi:hypothetical protein JCM4814A_94590 [Streptomyces phaeofaciens JCM 4814]|uniref:Uncharacterized protein n=1 Tax=Streptomyces phaeofaciens TaxID=68254 RepID=A0A918HSK7_9ACTN|nr:hypothetical protein GCM10010226_88330 [Streptomyces phaeofaciens]